MRGKLTIGPGEQALRNAVSIAVNGEAKRIVIDLKAVTAFDSNGVDELVSSYSRVTSRGGRIVLANLPNSADILTTTQLITVFHVYGSVDEAVAAVRS